MKTVLFVAYGGGHIRMVVPVARALERSGIGRAVVLALTTAGPVARQAGLNTMGFKDFLEPQDRPALQKGAELLALLPSAPVDRDESIAYMGLSYADLVTTLGPELAQAEFSRLGRQSFLPVHTLERVIRRLSPDLVVVTNSPRAERAAVLAAHHCGVPALCMVDLFAIDEVRWIGVPGYADRVCVLHESVRQMLLQAGRRGHEVVVTGNPAFDDLLSPENEAKGGQMRREHWPGLRAVLWPTQIEPAIHPFSGQPADSSLPGRVLHRLISWSRQREDVALCIRPREGDGDLQLASHRRVWITGPQWPLHPLLHACDVVVTMSSTVGLEGRLSGTRLIQVKGSVFEHAMPLASAGLADEVVSLEDLDAALARCIVLPRHPVHHVEPAAIKVVDEIAKLLGTRVSSP